MRKPKLSLIIPYEGRLDNLRLALEGLLHQTMNPAEFEVVIGTTKYDEDFVVACDKVARHLNLVTVMTHEQFEIPRARNMAMRQASGAVTVNMDADTLLPPDALERLYERHYAFGQDACVVGQVLGYGNNYDGDVQHVEPEPFEVWRERLAEMRSTTVQPLDPRFTTDHVIPWSFAWTGLIALPTHLVREHDLYFDESFVGWGVDDIEWGYRIAATRTPIILRKDVYALHLPHVRDTAANFVTEAVTYHQFLRKWPGPDVELAAAFSDFEANDLYLDFLAEVRSALPDGADLLGTVRVTVEGNSVVFLGVPLDSAHRIVDPDVRQVAASATEVEVLPLVGMAVPFDDASVTECRVLAAVRGLSCPYREKVMVTAHRLAPSVVEVGA